MSKREKTYNFCAGPSHLPDEVLEKAQAELLNWRGTGASIMEISHRGDEFKALVKSVESRMSELMRIPSHYKILLMQGGARLQFGCVPLNLLGSNSRCQYIEAGHWSRSAAAEGMRFSDDVKVWKMWEKSADEMRRFEDPSTWQIDPEAAYVHLTSNETCEGIELPDCKLQGAKKVASDMSSDILSREINVENYDVIYACAQKNIAPAGVTFVIVNPQSIDLMPTAMPRYLEYQQHIDHQSVYNTPVNFSVYMADLVLEWLQQQGGISVIEKRNREKASQVYDYIDQHADFYQNKIPSFFRSQMNISFYLPSDALHMQFIEESKAAGLLYLKGHLATGGIRVSSYNYQPAEAIAKLLQFMDDFYKKERK
jgi:phosphoserine aminotransferase